jgi:diaminohydroxyphosphoribosylaminopyrimidine deaminase/5-amino-6-(5-phosphoribosylamino)uracil reductase
LNLSGADARLLLSHAASLAAGSALDTLPNPPVGCVIVAEGGRVVGEGFHRHYGGPHAEAEALRAAGVEARGAVAFVTLEPCGGSAGKKTPPCAPALRDAGLRAVVYSCEDASPPASGKGPTLLRKAGVRVDRVDVKEADLLLARYRTCLEDPYPWIVAKWAMSLDGKMGDARGASRWISGEESLERAHDMRRRSDAVVVGARTAALDDPDLRPRPGTGPGGRIPLRVVVDEDLRISAESRLATTAREAPVLAACGARAPRERRRALEALGVEVEPHPGAHGRVDLRSLFRSLRGRGVRRALLEGGGEIHAAAFREGLVRQVAVFVAPVLLGGRTAPVPVSGPEGLRTAGDPLRLEEIRVMRLGRDVLVEGFVPADAAPGPERPPEPRRKRSRGAKGGDVPK